MAIDDAEDLAAVRASLARAEAGKDDGVPVELYRRLRAGEHPVRVWRIARSLGLGALAQAATVSRSYLSEIENGKKPGSADALRRLAAALRVDMEELATRR